VAEGRTQVVAHRIGEGLELSVAAAELLREDRQLLGLAQHYPHNGIAQLARCVDLALPPGQGPVAHHFFPDLEGLAGVETQAVGLGGLLRVATPAHGLHHLGMEPHHVARMELGDRDGQQAACAVLEALCPRHARCKRVGGEHLLARPAQPARDLAQMGGRWRRAHALAAVAEDHRRALRPGQPQKLLGVGEEAAEEVRLGRHSS
jgi:hypothetical protein